MKDVERVLRVVLQAADVLGAEFGEVERVRLFTVHAAEVDLVLGSGLGWCVCGVCGCVCGGVGGVGGGGGGRGNRVKIGG